MITKEHNHITISFCKSKPSVTDRLTVLEIHALRDEGKYYYELRFIPRGQSDRAIYAVGQYLWGIGYGRGFEEERLTLLNEWFFSRRRITREKEITRWKCKLYRAVYWESKEPRSELSDETIDRMVKTKTDIYGFKWANLRSTNIARAKIQAAKEACDKEGIKVTRNELCRRTECSPNTIRKHCDIWRDRSSSQGGQTLLLSNRSSVISQAGEGGGSQTDACKNSEVATAQENTPNPQKIVEIETAPSHPELKKIKKEKVACKRNSNTKLLSKHQKRLIRLQLGIEPQRDHEKKDIKQSKWKSTG